MAIFFLKNIGHEAYPHEVSMVMGLENAVVHLMYEIYHCSSECKWFNDGQDMLVTVANGRSFDIIPKRENGVVSYLLLEDH